MPDIDIDPPDTFLRYAQVGGRVVEIPHFVGLAGNLCNLVAGGGHGDADLGGQGGTNLAGEGGKISDFQDAQGLTGSYQNYLRVYGRELEPCPRCRQPVVRIVQQQRSSFYCPQCQR